MTGNMGRNHLRPKPSSPSYEAKKKIKIITTTTITTNINYSEWCRPRMIAHVQSQVKYSPAITHDAIALKDPGPRPAAPVPQKY